MQMSRRRWVVLAAAVLLLLIVPPVLFPHPLVWEHWYDDPEARRAVWAAYQVAIQTPRPSGVPLNGMTYTFAIQRVYPQDIEVVFLPRRGLEKLVFPVPGDEMHVILRRPDMVLVRWHFSE